jgi:hypothetical protein
MDWMLIPFTIVVFGFVFGFVLLVRLINYRETIALADRGLLKPKAGNGRGPLAWGVVITFLGVATMCGLYPVGWLGSSGRFPLNFGPWMLLGLLPTAFGLALLTVYAIAHRGEAPPGDIPAPPPGDITAPPADDSPALPADTHWASDEGAAQG